MVTRDRVSADHAAEYAQRFEVVLEGLNRKLFRWQRDWLKDRSKFKVALKARQLGYTTVSTLEAAIEAAIHPGLSVYLVSTTQDNAKKLLRQVRERWLPALQLCGHPGLRIAKDSEDEIALSNGARIYAIANEPARMRGNPGVYFFDEMAFWERRKLEEIMDGVQPTVASQLNPTSRFIALSTPWFEEGIYYELCKADVYKFFSRHEIDIYKAVRQGLPFDIDKVRAQMTSERWHREYCCGFLKGGTTYFSREGLLLLDAPKLITGIDPWARDLVEIFIGVDLAKISDFTAIVVLAKGPAGLKVLHTYQLRSVDYGVQARIIAQVARAWKAVGVAIDTTKHSSFVDQAPDELKSIAVAKDFTNKWKGEWIPRIKKACEGTGIVFDFEAASLWDSQARIFTKTPSRILLDDMARVVQGQTPSGLVKFDVPRTKIGGVAQDGHGDSFSAFLLAFWLAGGEGDAGDWGGEVVRPVITKADELPWGLDELAESWQGDW